MSGRESLREFQLRLVQRLAMADGACAAWLAVRAGSLPLLLPLAQSGEILLATALTPVPYTADWFLGVAHARGVLYGVVDLGIFLGQAVGQSNPAWNPSSRQTSSQIPNDATPGHAATPLRAGGIQAGKYLSLHPDLGVPCALRVDAFAGLRGADSLGDADAPANAPAFYGKCRQDGAGVVWQELDLRALATCPQFLDIAQCVGRGG
ncbi:chemotaxis protein CheW [Candidatus Symbiobacter mobilis]|uniref:Twitching motility protein PilI n=1 Tax=Candidatus Symbiobacter mobilis CR TaxID=946483 RepID=U5NAC9_9BURK|nr:chemotaxis protein CheW [Candidatus Symbiobacter mobilis]AGX87213.1 twitching motility protein PilI [Candidatus Symbiobacter mobilis CR]